MIQYGVRRDDDERVERVDRKQDAATIARDWAISPLRTGPRRAQLMRRRGWEGAWEVIATWTSPEARR